MGGVKHVLKTKLKQKSITSWMKFSNTNLPSPAADAAWFVSMGLGCCVTSFVSSEETQKQIFQNELNSTIRIKDPEESFLKKKKN